MTIENTPEGDPTARLCNRYLHSRHNPVREAERLITNICGESSGGVGVFLGFGLGYQIDAFRLQYPESPILIVESRPSLFLKALGTRDFSELFLPRTTLLLGSTVEELSLLLTHYSEAHLY